MFVYMRDRLNHEKQTLIVPAHSVGRCLILATMDEHERITTAKSEENDPFLSLAHVVLRSELI